MRGFKVHVSVVDPLAVPAGGADGRHRDGRTTAARISNANDHDGFTYTRDFLRTTDDYSRARSATLPSTTATARRPERHADHRFRVVELHLPDTRDHGSDAVGEFVAATNGAVNFGGTVGSDGGAGA